MRILALDVGKSKSVAYLTDRETGEVEFRTIRTRPAEVEALVTELRPDQVVFEIGPMAGWLHDLATAAGVKVLVANPTHEGWKWRNVKRKTDRLDAQKLADLTLLGQLPTVHLPAKAVRERRALIRFRTRLVDHRTEVKNRIRAILDREGRSMPAGAKAWTHKGLALLEAEARAADAVEPEELWRLELGVSLRDAGRGRGPRGRGGIEARRSGPGESGRPAASDDPRGGSTSGGDVGGGDRRGVAVPAGQTGRQLSA